MTDEKEAANDQIDVIDDEAVAIQIDEQCGLYMDQYRHQYYFEMAQIASKKPEIASKMAQMALKIGQKVLYFAFCGPKFADGRMCQWTD